MKEISRRDWFFFFALVAVSIFFRIYHLSNIPAICGDEAWTAAQAQLAAKDLPHTWFVTAQRFLSPFYIVLSFLSQGVEPFGIRYPAFMMGVLAVLFSYPLLSRVISKEAAFLTTLLISVLPIHIEFSRLAWELCLVPIAGLLFSTLILKKKWIYAIVCLIAGTLCHPSFILLTSVLTVTFFLEKKSTHKLPSIPWILLGVVCLCGLAAWAYTWLPPSFLRTDLSLNNFLIYMAGVAAIFMGTVGFATMADFVPATISWILIILFYTLIGTALWSGRRKITAEIKFFLIGVGLAIIAAFLAGGLSVVSPGYERASLFYCLPICIILGASLSAMKFGKFITYCFSVLLLCLTYFYFFAPVFEHGGRLSREFHTGPVDPKYGALEWIVKDAPAAKKYFFVAQDYNIFWNTLNYTMANLPGEIVMRHTSEQGSLHQDYRLHTREEILEYMRLGAFVISYADGELYAQLESLKEDGIKIFRKGFKDYAEKDFIFVWKLQPND